MVGEVEPRLGWVLFGGLQGGSKVGGGFQREEIFVSIGVGGRRESVLAMVEYGVGVVGGEAAGLDPKIEEDSIRFLVAKGTDCSLVDTGDKGSSGTARAEAVSFNAIRRDVSDMVNSAGSAPQFSSDVTGCDVMGAM